MSGVVVGRFAKLPVGAELAAHCAASLGMPVLHLLGTIKSEAASCFELGQDPR